MITRSNTVCATDDGQLTALVLLDLSSPFDTIASFLYLIDGSRSMVGRSVVSDRTMSRHRLTTAGSQTDPVAVNYSVPQGLVMGPVKFISYTEDVVDLLDSHHVAYHLFADDKQLCLSFAQSVNQSIFIYYSMTKCRPTTQSKKAIQLVRKKQV